MLIHDKQKQGRSNEEDPNNLCFEMFNFVCLIVDHVFLTTGNPAADLQCTARSLQKMDVKEMSAQ